MYVEAVSPATSTPPASHWKPVVTPLGVHVPAVAVSTWPTFAVPVSVGAVRFVIVPATTAEVAAEVALAAA